MENFESRYFRGQGPFFLGDRDADGNPINLVFCGDLESAELTPDIQRNTTYENVSGKNTVGASYLQRVSYNVALGFRSIKKGHFGQALGATATEQTADSVTDERHTAKVGGFARLKHLKVSNVALTQDPDGTATSLTEGTDYKVHADEGLIEFLSGGAVSDDDEIGADYDYAAQTDFLVDPGNEEKYGLFAGMNSADEDKQTRCEMYKLQLDPSALSAITSETTNMSVDGLLMLDRQRAKGDQLYRWITED